MNVRRRAILSLAAAFSVCHFSLARADNGDAGLRSDLQRIADDYLSSHAESEGITAVSISISVKPETPNINVASGKTSWRTGAGPARTDNLYQIGSITKSMTAVIALQLASEGKLSLDTPIGTWLPEYPAWKDKTLRQLLSMTSGIATYDELPAFIATIGRWGLRKHFSLPQLVSFLDPDLPGAPAIVHGYSYSNTNYILAQMIVERATGQSFVALIGERIFQRAGLRQTFYHDGVYPQDILGRMVRGRLYHLVPEMKALTPLLPEDISAQDMSWAQAAGGAVATVEDVTHWARQLYSGGILDSEERKELQSLVSMKSGDPITGTSADEPQGFGLGVMASRFKGQTIWAYEGGSMGFRVLYAYFPSHDLVIAVGLNSNPGDGDDIGSIIRNSYAAVTGENAEGDTKVQPAN